MTGLGTGHGEKFTRRQEAALAAILTCSSLPAAAETCKVSERTLRRWLQDPAFAERFRRERTQLLEISVNLLRQKAGAAIETLAAVSDDNQAPVSPRVAAARAIVELTLRAAELADIEQRITDLEQIARDKL